MRALAIAATGMTAQQLNTEVVANNIANISTTGFKRARAEFADLLYQAERVAGTANRGGSGPIPEGAQVGLGVRSVAVRNVHLQGALTNTGNKLDLALNGRGWFQVASPDGETFYTRAGAFNRNADGELVTLDGNRVEPNITFPDTTTEIIINESGQVYARTSRTEEPQLLGQLSLATFANEAGLEPLGGNLFRETTASGSATTAVAGSAAVGTIHQGHLESSNVDPVREITDLIQAQRSYEMNSKVIQAVDDMFGTIAKGIR